MITDVLKEGPILEDEAAFANRYPLAEEFAARAEKLGYPRMAMALRNKLPRVQFNRYTGEPHDLVEDNLVSAASTLLTVIDTDRFKKVSDPKFPEGVATQIVLLESDGSLGDGVSHSLVSVFVGILGLGADSLGDFMRVSSSDRNPYLFRSGELGADMQVASLPVEIKDSPFDTSLELAKGTGERGAERLQLTVIESVSE